CFKRMKTIFDNDIQPTFLIHLRPELMDRCLVKLVAIKRLNAVILKQNRAINVRSVYKRIRKQFPPATKRCSWTTVNTHARWCSWIVGPKAKFKDPHGLVAKLFK